MTRARRVNVGVLLGGLTVMGALVALLASGFGTDPHAVPSVLVNKPAPAFALPDLDGQRWDLETLKGKPLVLNFWSTWCLPCKQEHQLLQQAALGNSDVQFLGVIYSDTADKARLYLARAGTTYDHLIDADGRAAIDYGVAGVPETYFIDASGTIVYKQVGPLTPRTIEPLLQLVRGAR